MPSKDYMLRLTLLMPKSAGLPLAIKLVRSILVSLLILLFIVAPSCRSKRPHTTAQLIKDLKPTVLMISLDGFRSDYLERGQTPTLQSLIQQGVTARLKPVFPTKTFPNHFTIATGLRPEHHGIVSNKIYDPEMDANFPNDAQVSTFDSRWWHGEPIWITARRQGQVSATIYWPGSETKYNNLQANYCLAYESQLPYDYRIEQVFAWLEKPVDQRPTLMNLYIEELDQVGHHYGPDAPQIQTALQTVDQLLADLLKGLQTRGIADQINIVITSDHGMTGASSAQTIYIDDYIDTKKLHTIEESPCLWVWPTPEQLESTYQTLVKANSHLKVYRKSEIPAKFQYQESVRIPPIIAVADEGWTISTHTLSKSIKNNFISGLHGYDPDLPSMQGIFIAQGPAFKKGLAAPMIDNVNIYNLVAKILQLQPAPNDGCADCLNSLLQP